MNTVSFYDEAFRATQSYQTFLRDNPGSSVLNIRASGASLAIPISGVRVIVSKDIDNYKVIFYDGLTDLSGMINDIKLPTPSVVSNDLDVPNGTVYDIEAIYDKDNIDRKYSVLMYPNIYTVQNINVLPTLNVFGDNYGG